MYLQISSKRYADFLRYTKFLFGQVDPFYHKTSISFAKIACAQLAHNYVQIVCV